MKLLILIACIAYVGISEGVQGRPRVNQLNPSEATVRARREFNQKYDRTRIDIGDAEQLALKSLFRDIENAYKNYQPAAMERAMANVSNRIDHVQGQLFIDLHWSMMSFFADNFIHGAVRRQSATSIDFETFLATHTRAALFMGECYCRRNDYSDSLSEWIEIETFRTLKALVERFRKDGRRDFEAIAQKFLDMWVAHIESRQGFVRRYAHYLLENDLSLIEVGRRGTREEIINRARKSADALIRRGYTPKWLDEFK